MCCTKIETLLFLMHNIISKFKMLYSLNPISDFAHKGCFDFQTSEVTCLAQIESTKQI